MRTDPKPAAVATATRSRARFKVRSIVAVVAFAALTPVLAGYAVDSAGADKPTPIGPGLVTVELDMRYSKYSTNQIHVYQGTLVKFVVTNSDPINHELIVGPESVHRAHETGHDQSHPPVPGEVSVGPRERGLTTYRFDQVGTVRYACHLPGHAGYGMTGEIVVVAIPEPAP